MYPILQIGPFELRSYGVIVALSFLATLWLARKEAARKGLNPALVVDFNLYGLIGGMLGARLYFIAFSDPLAYLSKPWEIFAVWQKWAKSSLNTRPRSRKTRSRNIYEQRR